MKNSFGNLSSSKKKTQREEAEKNVFGGRNGYAILWLNSVWWH